MGQAETKVEIADDWDTILIFSKQLGGCKQLCPAHFGITSNQDYILNCDQAKNMKQIILHQMGSDMTYDSDLRMFTQGVLDKKKRKHAHERWTKVIQQGVTWESDNLESSFNQIMNSVSNSDYVTVTNVAVKEFTREIKASTTASLPSAMACVTKSVTTSGLDVALATAMLLPPTLTIMDSLVSRLLLRITNC